MTSLKRVVSIANAAVLALSTLMTLSFTGVAHATAQTCIWTGASSNSFNTAGNWSACGGGVPQASDFIKFNAPISSSVTLTNNLGVALGGVVAGQVADNNGSGTSYFGNYIIDTISLAAGATLTQDASTDCTKHAQGVEINAVTSTGSISDSANMTNSATLTIGGDYTTTDSTVHAGDGSVVTGGVIVASPIASAPLCGGAGGFSSGPSITGFTINSLTVQKGASVDLGNTTFPLIFGGGSGTGTPMVNFFGNLDSNNDNLATTYTVSGAITLLTDAQFHVDDLTTVNVTGAISGTGFAITRDPGSDATGTLNMQPSSNTSSTATGSLVNPTVTTTISDSQPNTSAVVVDNETTVLDGQRDNVNVMNGGVLKGTGTAGSVYVSKGGIIAPGHSPGTLTVTSILHFGVGSTYQAELKNAAAGGFDQIVVGSASDTTGNDVELDTSPSPTLSVSLYSGYSIKAGDQFEIINNLSKTAVSGTFDGLPEGTTFQVGSGVFKISYVGGDGNDVVLTAMKTISAPDTGFAFVSAHPSVTLGVSAVAAIAIFGLARKNMRKVAPARAKATRR